jgi:hypothetical protein
MFGIPNGGDTMKATQILHDLGQSLWLDNITRDLLDSSTLQRYIDELSVTGLTSNPTIFDQAIKHSTAYDTSSACRPSWRRLRSRTSRGSAGLSQTGWQRLRRHSWEDVSAEHSRAAAARSGNT